MNMKFEMVIDDPPLDEADVAAEPLIVGVLLPHAARSRAPAMNRTPAPHFNRVRICLRCRAGGAERDG